MLVMDSSRDAFRYNVRVTVCGRYRLRKMTSFVGRHGLSTEGLKGFHVLCPCPWEATTAGYSRVSGGQKVIRGVLVRDTEGFPERPAKAGGGGDGHR